MGRLNGGTNEGKQHFSHQHVLKQIVNPTETLTCNACEKPNNSNKPFYGCNTCQYFLHENCFNAPRILNHSSHPLHPLTLHQIPSYASGSYICNACGSVGNGFCFNCAGCEFDIHLQFGVFPKQLQRPNPSRNSHATAAVEMINSVNDDHDRLITAQIAAQIDARGRRAMLDLI
ncbi:hypothetical protein KY285_001881 [Solanum tuberosum]|nr:hypothetical protein KY284_002036 [Solanum tuberosum]KAH0766010.1 hypothetical protein KY285_001881 [Solanum tuberosum]